MKLRPEPTQIVVSEDEYKSDIISQMPWVLQALATLICSGYKAYEIYEAFGWTRDDYLKAVTQIRNHLAQHRTFA